MSKILALGLLTVVLSTMSLPLLAADFEPCETSKEYFQEIGVYGLCNAWHNADEEDQQKFADKFTEKAGFPPPWIAPPCPCFSIDALAYPDDPENGPFAPDGCMNTASTAWAWYLETRSIEYVATSGMCYFKNATGVLDSPPSVGPLYFADPDVVQECFDAVRGLIAADFHDGCN